MSTCIKGGDCRASMRGLPEESIHACVTSIPYYALRSYGTEPQVWGDPGGCEHVWGEAQPGKRSRWGDLSTLSEKQASNGGSAAMVEALEAPGGSFCGHCDAWRGELGLEPSVDLYVAHVVEVFSEVWRVLRKDGTCWLNVADSYSGTVNGRSAADTKATGRDDRTFRDKPIQNAGSGLKPKDLCLVPQRLALALQAAGWWVRCDVIWSKPNPMPESLGGWSWQRHRVTIKEYERLSSLQKARGGSDENRPGDVSGLPQEEVGSGTHSVSRKRPRTSNNEGLRTAHRSQEAASQSGSFRAGEGEQQEVSCHPEGQRDCLRGTAAILRNGEGPGSAAGEGSSPRTEPREESEAAEIRAPLSAVSQREGDGSEQGCAAAWLAEGDGCAADDAGMGGDTGSAQPSLLLLRDGREDDDRPRDPIEQGRAAHSDERGAGVSPLQSEEGRTGLVACPGCPKCEPNGGLVLCRDSGRPTKAHEYILLLAKSPAYYWDAEAVKEQAAEPDRQRSDRIGGANGHTVRHSPGGMMGASSGRNLRSVWTINPQPFLGAHFATYPEELVRRCILASTSEAGCCPSCGAPYARVIEEGEPDREWQRACGGDANGLYHGAAVKDYGSARAEDASSVKARILAGMRTRKTTGWRPTCTCAAGDPVPATVLDPFTGSGTTGLVAKKHGRSFVGCELKEDYAAMAEDRIGERGQRSLFA